MVLIVVTGTPGTGKSSFALRLSELLSYECIDLNDFLIVEGCISDYDAKRESHVVDLVKGERLVKSSFESGDYILESHIAHLIVPKDMVSTCFVLRSSPYVLMKRLEARGFSRGKVMENCAAEILDTILGEVIKRYGKDLISELDTSGDLEDLVEEAIKVLRNEKPRRVGGIDWLTLITERDDLKLFFGE
ncbi:MAG: AAA family ATPase [Nitrososphaeria archaeon]|nr:AAA family ATPase [Nitrososphaeria archaeon]NIN52428.1 AAA family ATPase [Nitrososphaeria archaeon]NIQ32929.1 AAA family ATPase [Nitrososphaeria archaeon]